MREIFLFWHPSRASCPAAREFVGERRLAFESVNAAEGQGRRRLVHVLGGGDDGLLDGPDLPREVF